MDNIAGAIAGLFGTNRRRGDVKGRTNEDEDLVDMNGRTNRRREKVKGRTNEDETLVDVSGQASEDKENGVADDRQPKHLRKDTAKMPF